MYQNTKVDFEMTFLCFYLHLILATVLLMVPRSTNGKPSIRIFS